uniref:Putative ovule protein n=1 Tax=Solanum chacoense TaxID=4108 RepID=A0A0V0GVA7_SOLCH
MVRLNSLPETLMADKAVKSNQKIKKLMTRETRSCCPLGVHRVKLCSYSITRKPHRRGNPH